MYGPGAKWGQNPDAMLDKEFKRLSEVRATSRRLHPTLEVKGVSPSVSRVPAVWCG
jgi:hypothetical protein